jgi:hypothetical protein
MTFILVWCVSIYRERNCLQTNWWQKCVYAKIKWECCQNIWNKGQLLDQRKYWWYMCLNMTKIWASIWLWGHQIFAILSTYQIYEVWCPFCLPQSKGNMELLVLPIVLREQTLLYHYEGHKHMSDFGNPKRWCKIGTIATRLIFLVMSTMHVHHGYANDMIYVWFKTIIWPFLHPSYQS